MLFKWGCLCLTSRKSENDFQLVFVFVQFRFLLAGRPLSNPNTKIFIDARWVKLVYFFMKKHENFLA